MGKFEPGMEGMIDAYIFEATSLLERLDQILMATESNSSFGEEDINEIFRIMHTIKGSSAMMGLDNMSKLAHAVEDMFFIIREEHPVIAQIESLYDLVFKASDLLKAEIDLIQEDEYEPTDFTALMETIRGYAASLKDGSAAVPAAAPAQTAAPAPAPAAAEPAPAAAAPVEMQKVATLTTVKVMFDDDCRMENLRALIIVNKLQEECLTLRYEPADIETNPDTAKTIIENGFIIHFKSATTDDNILKLIEESLNVKSYEVLEYGSDDGVDVPSAELTTVKVTFEADCKMENLRALMVVNNIRDMCELLAYEPSDIEDNSATADIIVNNGFIIHFKSSHTTEEIMAKITETPSVDMCTLVKEGAPAAAPAPVPAAAPAPAASTPAAAPAEQKTAAPAPAPAKKAEAPKPAAPAAPAAQKAPAAASGTGSKGKQSLISVNLNKLDQLLDMVGEIVITEAMVTSNPDLKGLQLDNFQKAARQLRKLTDELQDIVMSIRMIPLSGAFNKMTRIVRDMKIKLNKDVDLIFEGEDTEVDKSIIDSLNDPLMHMVRNSMDHGIEETAQERIDAGKDPKGKITLAAYSSSGEVVITVSDDGYGINTEKVLAKARKNGLLTKPDEEYSKKEIFNMIMLPGFSTNEQVTEYSGRGVGMDVVKKGIEKIGGTVSVDSKEGFGTSFIIKIPLSLAIVDGMEVSVGESIFTIPISSIKESFKLKENQLIKDTSGKEMIMIRGQCYPLIRLYELYELETKVTDIYEGIIILVENEGRSACLMADELIGEQQVVVKPFSPMLNNFNVKQNGMAGCSILGDGSITIILDIGNIISDF